MPEALTDLFRRDLDAGMPADVARPDLTQVHRLARRIRRRQFATACAAAAVAVVVIAAATPVLRGGGDSDAIPAVTHDGIAELTRSRDGFLELPDLLRRDEPAPATRWQINEAAPPGDRIMLPACTQEGTTAIAVPSGAPRVRTWTGTSQRTEISVAQTVVRLDPQTAARADALLAQARTCSDSLIGAQFEELDGAQTVLAEGPGILVTGTMQRAMRPSQPAVISGPVYFGGGYARSGDTLVIVTAMGNPGSTAEGLPGQSGWLIDLTVRALGRATGQSVRVPEPNRAAQQAAAMAASQDNPAPPGMLTLADLGSDKPWVLSPAGPESRVGVAVAASVPGCGSSPLTMVRGTGTEQSYRSKTPSPTDPSGYFHSLVEERRISVPHKDVAGVRAALTALASCGGATGGEQVVRTGTDPLRVVTGQRLRGETVPAGEWHHVYGMALLDQTFVVLDSSVSQGTGTLPPQTGHVDWVDRLLPVAARRAAAT